MSLILEKGHRGRNAPCSERLPTLSSSDEGDASS